KISTLAQSNLVKQQVSRLQGELLKAQGQLSTGKQAQTLSGLGTDASRVLSLRNQLQATAQYEKTITTTELRMDVFQNGFLRVREIAEDIGHDGITAAFENIDRLPTL